MGKSLALKLIESHLVDGDPVPGREIGITVDQTLTQDATGTLVMLELEAMGLSRVETEVSVQYVDHNLIQADAKNPDDHVFLFSASRRFGLWFSRPGNGVSHPVHMERFGIPGKSLLGSDSHSCAAGCLGMLAIGAGGIEVAAAMAGHPFRLTMPTVTGVRIEGELPRWVSAKDVILELLRRYGAGGAEGKILEYHGPGLEGLTAMDRHVIANMGAELGATTSVFPSDDAVRRFLWSQRRETDWVGLRADDDADYDEEETLDLSRLEPLIACPGSPGNVVPVESVAGREIAQAYVGSSANPGYRDLGVVARMVDGFQVHPQVSLDISPASRQILESLVASGLLGKLIRSGARLHQAGCNGCIGMGQAPATGTISLRTVPRNFPGRSGTRDDLVYLCSPETAGASALTGRITDPRSLGMEHPRVQDPVEAPVNESMLLAPDPETVDVELIKGPNIRPLPELDSLPSDLRGPVLLALGDDVSTDEILPAGADVLPLRSNIPEIAKHAFAGIDSTFYSRARAVESSCSFIVAGHNYGQGSSREHAALAPRFLGVRVILARSFARIHRTNLASYGILPLVFLAQEDRDAIECGEELEIEISESRLKQEREIEVRNRSRDTKFKVSHDLSDRRIDAVLAGGVINQLRTKGGRT